MPPRGVRKGTKRARQYEKIKRSTRRRGASESRAEEIAARTVNKAKSGRPIRRGGPRGRTREQLYNDAKKLGIEGRASMNKRQLQRAVAGASK